MRARRTALGRCFDDGRLGSTTTRPNAPALRRDRSQKLFLRRFRRRRPSRPRDVLAIKTAKLNGLDPQLYLADVLTRIADHPARQIAELLPWPWQPADLSRSAA
jgi:hypothetical protein